MRKLILITALGIGMAGATAFGSDYRSNDYRVGYVNPHRDSLEREVNHLNGMLSRVQWQLRRYHADWRMRRDVQNISREVSRLNYRYRHGEYNHARLGREVDRLHDRLHAIEQQLRVRPGDRYRWY